MSFQKCSKEAGFPPALTDSQLGWLTTRPWQDVPIMVGYFKRTAAPPSQRPFYAMPTHIMYLLYKSRRFVCRKHSLWLVQDNCWIIMVISQTATGRILSQRGIKKKKKTPLVQATVQFEPGYLSFVTQDRKMYHWNSQRMNGKCPESLHRASAGEMLRRGVFNTLGLGDSTGICVNLNPI